ncbi:MAG: hypothetical protein KGL39_49775 [Patescibacteria group bacterium]|nr:hypothetical protein [Patescibacteria group bacterium]
MRFDLPDVPCGCKPCGCLCPEHSASGLDDLCARHGLPVVARWIAGEALALVALGLLIASVVVLGAISSVPAPFG